jgi:four helix bundle protein
MKTFRELLVWQKSLILIKNIYQVSSRFPKSELFGITSQMRRCAISIPCNISEGYGRHSTREYIRFLRISMGSLFELMTILEISLEMIPIEEYKKVLDQIDEIERMLYSLIKKLMTKV